jgi:hypothetical protein
MRVDTMFLRRCVGIATLFPWVRRWRGLIHISLRCNHLLLSPALNLPLWQLYTSVNGEKPQTLNTSDSIIPSFRNGRTSSHNTSQSEGQIQSRAQEEVITPQGYMYQPPPPPYPGKKRCYANTFFFFLKMQIWKPKKYIINW